MFYCSKRHNDQKQLNNLDSLPTIIYITKYTIGHYDILLQTFIVNLYSKWRHAKQNATLCRLYHTMLYWGHLAMSKIRTQNISADKIWG